jgi:glutamate synthase (NADPH) large chain
MRKCHLNTCPVGVATQDPELRKKFEGKPEHVINFMFYVAEETRQWMAKLGYRTIEEMVGQSDRLKTKKIEHWKARTLNFGDVHRRADAKPGVGIFKQQAQDHGVERSLDIELIEKAKAALEQGTAVEFPQPISNVHRTVGAQLAGEVARRYAADGLPAGTIKIHFKGTAGQSFGAFMARGMEFHLTGDSNDYVGKGMSGGLISVKAPEGSTYPAEDNVLIGNVVMYGATGGKAFFNGRAGERFCVRNSGGTAVVEGVGDHGCEYMTGGVVVVLGKTGRNFAAGMSGGIAYVLDSARQFTSLCNTEMVSLVEPSDVELAQVKALVEEHLALTGSALATQLLNNWGSTKHNFVKVYPNEYRRVLEERARNKAKAAGAATASAPN